MKTVRTGAAAALALLACSVPAFAQSGPQVVNIPLSRPGEPITLDIDLMSARIEVVGEERDDAMFEITIASGERKIVTPSGTQSVPGSSYSFELDEDDNEISLDADWRSSKVTVLARIPRRADVELNTVNNGELVIRNVTGNIELYNVNGPITASDISGSVIAESVNDTIDIGFASIDDGSVSSLETINGDLYVRLPRDVGIEVHMDAGRGEITSDFDVNVMPSEPRVQREDGDNRVSVKIENVIVAQVSGGGPVVRLKTLHGGIHIRATE